MVFPCNRLNSATEESLFLRDPVDTGQCCGVMKLPSTFFVLSPRWDDDWAVGDDVLDG